METIDISPVRVLGGGVVQKTWEVSSDHVVYPIWERYSASTTLKYDPILEGSSKLVRQRTLKDCRLKRLFDQAVERDIAKVIVALTLRCKPMQKPHLPAMMTVPPDQAMA